MKIQFSSSHYSKQTERSQRSGPKMVPGAYQICVDELEECVSQKGNPQIKAKFVVSDGDLKGHRLTHFLGFTEYQIAEFARFLKACNPNGEPAQAFDTAKLSTLIGKELIARVNHEQTETMLYTRVRDFYHLTEADEARADVDIDDKVTVRKPRPHPSMPDGSGPVAF